MRKSRWSVRGKKLILYLYSNNEETDEIALTRNTPCTVTFFSYY